MIRALLTMALLAGAATAQTTHGHAASAALLMALLGLCLGWRRRR